MKHSFKNFWLPGIFAILIVASIVRSSVSIRIAFVDQLLAKPDASGLIAALVLVVVLWSVIGLFFRRASTNRELRVIHKAGQTIRKMTGRGASAIVSAVEEEAGADYQNSILERRFLLLQERTFDSGDIERMTNLIAGQSGVDVAHMQSAYGPLRALVWSLPAFGFMGTAIEMANAIGGMSTALNATQGYNDLRGLLVSQVVPPLAGAFSITLFALASSVVCFLLLSLVYQHEETVLTEADAISLQILAAAGSDAHSVSTNSSVAPLSADLQSLALQISQLNSAFTQLQQGGGYNLLIPLLRSINDGITKAGMSLAEQKVIAEQDMVIVRTPRTPRS